MSKKSTNTKNLFFNNFLSKPTVELYFLALRKCSKLATSKRKSRKPKCISRLLRLMKSFNVNYKRIRRGV